MNKKFYEKPVVSNININTGMSAAAAAAMMGWPVATVAMLNPTHVTSTTAIMGPPRDPTRAITAVTSALFGGDPKSGQKQNKLSNWEIIGLYV